MFIDIIIFAPKIIKEILSPSTCTRARLFRFVCRIRSSSRAFLYSEVKQSAVLQNEFIYDTPRRHIFCTSIEACASVTQTKARRMANITVREFEHLGINQHPLPAKTLFIFPHPLPVLCWQFSRKLVKNVIFLHTHLILF